MAKVREELVGKRFLSVSKSCKLKLSKISEWDWRAGVIRACTHSDSKHPELQILVEYEDVSWQRREWILVHKEQAFQVLLVEHTLVWAPKHSGTKLRGSSALFPALVFNALVDEVGLCDTKERPLEYITDRSLEFHDYAVVRNYQDGECLRLGDEESEEAVRSWVAEQDGQRILCTTPSVLVGFRVQVYRSEGTTQWYTAVIVGYNETTRELTVTDDTVLEEHSEDPSLVHIRLLGEGVVESILRGENVGITSRRSRSASNNHHQTGARHNRREQVISTRGRKSCVSTKNVTPSASPLQGLSPSGPHSPQSPISKAPNHQSSLQTRSEDQESVQEELPFSDLGRFASHPDPLGFSSDKKDKDTNAASGTTSLHSPQVEKPTPRNVHSDPNQLNSPSSPTNPDKPTNPRLENQHTEPSVSLKESVPEAGPRITPASKEETQERKVLKQEPKKDTPYFRSNQRGINVNSTLRRVVIKLKNNLQYPIKPEQVLKKECTELPKEAPKKENTSEDSLRPKTLPVSAPTLPVGTPTFSVSASKLPVGTPTLSVSAPKLPVGTPTLPVSATKLPASSPKLPVSAPALLESATTLSLGANSLPVGASTVPVSAATLPIGSATLTASGNTLPLGTTTSPVVSASLAVAATTVPVGTSTLPDKSKSVSDRTSESKSAGNDFGEAPEKELLKSESGSPCGNTSDTQTGISSGSTNSSSGVRAETKLVTSGPDSKSISRSSSQTDSGRSSVTISDSNKGSNFKLETVINLFDSKFESVSELHSKSEVLASDSKSLSARGSDSNKSGSDSNKSGSNSCKSGSDSSKLVSDSVKSDSDSNKLVPDSVKSESDSLKFDSDSSKCDSVSLNSKNLVSEESSAAKNQKTESEDQIKKEWTERDQQQTVSEKVTEKLEKVQDRDANKSVGNRSPVTENEAKKTADNSPTKTQSEFKKSSVDVNPLCNGRVRPFPVVLARAPSPKSTSLSIDRPISGVPDNLRVKSSAPRQVILLSSVDGCLKLEKENPESRIRTPAVSSPSISVASLPSPVLRTSEASPQKGNAEAASRLLPADCTLSVSLVSDSQSRTAPRGESGGLSQSLAAAGAVSGRAVTITATSGPAPQGGSRVASPPSVSITAVVRSPPQAYPHHHHSESATHHHDGAAAPPLPLPHPQPPPQPYAPLAPTHTRMDQGDGSSDSGVSVTERSVSRSSVLSDDRSSSAEVKPNTPTPTAVPPNHPQLPKTSLPPLIVDRKEAVKVWRNPAVLSQSEISVRHIHSLQHSQAMSQHFPGVPAHIAPPGGAPQPPHPASHPAPHGPPPPPHTSSLSHHGIPASLHYAPPPLHLNPGLSAAAALYPQLQQDVWKQLGSHVSPLTPHAYATLMPRQEDLSYLEHAREMEKHHQAERFQREREAREKQAKEKMERERVERQRKDRERRERDERERARRVDYGGGETAGEQLVDKHFEASLRNFSQKHGRENMRHLSPGESHQQAAIFYAGHGIPNQQSSPHLTHNQSLLLPQHQQHSQNQQQNKIYQPHSQKGSHWNQNFGSLSMKVDSRDHRQVSRHPPPAQLSESVRKPKEPEQFVQESIYKAFSRSEEQMTEPHLKHAGNPPPAHSKHSVDKTSSLTGYPVHLGIKDLKHHPIDRSPYPLPHEKASVIVQPDPKYEKIAQHSVSPKQRPPERSSPYSTNPANHYKSYDPSPPPHRGSTPHHTTSLSPIPHSVELTKARQPLSSPHAASSATHAERYYSGTKAPPSGVPGVPYQSNPLVPGGHVQNHMHNMNTLPCKAKVSSPPQQMYFKPGIAQGTSVCKIESRPSSQPLPLTSKASSNGPPPAHSGNRVHESRPPPNPHDQRVSHNRSPFDTRHHYVATSNVSNLKAVTTSVVSHPHPTSSRTPNASPHMGAVPPPPHQPPQAQPPQTQPLDLGTRDGGSSPTNRRRSQTPTPQEAKRPRIEPASSPLLSRVSEPSPLYPSAATTITTVENTVALANLQRVSSPAVIPPHSSASPASGMKTTSVITNTSNEFSSISSESSACTTTTPTIANGTSKPSQTSPSNTPSLTGSENSPSPGSLKYNEPEKSSSPGPSAGGYVHKLKKAWLQRLKTGAETPPSPTLNTTRSSTPTPPSILNTSAKASTSISTPVKQEVKAPLRKPKPMVGVPGLPNGHEQESKDLDSSSSDSEGSSNSSNAKRSKTKRAMKRTKKSSESNSDSDKESDGSEGSIKKSENLPQKQDIEPRRRRGRKPKIKQEKEDGLKPKKIKDETPITDPLHKPPVSQLKKSGESFLQDGSCYEVSPKLPKCRECRWTPHQRNKKMPNIFCRFYAFRRLRYTKNGQLAVAGFSDPVKDAFGEDLRLWVPDHSAPAPDLDCEKSKFLITHVGDQFCDLVQQEKEAMALHMGEDTVIAWKRVVQGVREMCDVCETTLFNIHWACSKCGFVVCIDCYKGRKEGTVKVWDVEDGAKERDKFSWLLCASRLPHEQDKLMLTQIIAGNALTDLGRKIHEIRYKRGVPMYCGCPEDSKYKEKEQEDKKLNGISKDLIKSRKKESKCDLVNGTAKLEKEGRINGKDDDLSNSPLRFFADVALSNDKRESETSNSDSDSDSDDKESQPSTLRELLTVRPNSKSSAGAKEEPNSATKIKEPSKKKAKLDTLDDVISCVIESGVDKDNKKDPMKVELKHFIRKYNYNRKGREPLPIRIMTKTESRLLYPNVPHSWLCDGKLLRLHDPLHPENVGVFQDQWKRGQPVIVSGTGQNLSSELWKPQSFSRDFGEVKNNLINCLTENIVPNQPMKKFWDGFEHYSKRLKDDKGHPMVLKLKDWPPGDDFAEMLPSRFEDLMKVLPMGQYTRRNGSFNLAGRLPECFVRPDLGPKMYIAYGSASFPSKASTNLHLDISDAVNVMCYVGIPKDVEFDENVRETLKAIDEAGCDILTRQRVREKDEIPGALWHIYHARDSDKIRDLLNKVAIERGKKLEPYHDPIHDQSWYLDGPLRERLYKEYAVEGYAIVQCMGDAVFIPAGTPHQVRNLHNCVKVAEDFVSPENVSHCFHLTQEFRHLSDTHTNHEDKLQIKNIIYHAMKDSIAALMTSEKKILESKVKKEES